MLPLSLLIKKGIQIDFKDYISHKKTTKKIRYNEGQKLSETEKGYLFLVAMASNELQCVSYNHETIIGKLLIAINTSLEDES